MSAAAKPSAAHLLGRREKLVAAFDDAMHGLAAIEAVFDETVATAEAALDAGLLARSLDEVVLAGSAVATAERRLDRLAVLVLRHTAAVSRLIASAKPVAGSPS